MRGFIAALLVGVTIFLAVGCGGESNDAAGTTTVVVTETTAADTTSTATDTTSTIDTDTSTDATDTTSTDTTSTDTTSTDTTADTATTAAGLTVGCQKVANLSVQFGKALSAAGASGGTDLEKTAKAYEAFAQQVPGGDPGRLRDPGEGLRAVRRSDSRASTSKPARYPTRPRSRSSPRRRSPSTARTSRRPIPRSRCGSPRTAARRRSLGRRLQPGGDAAERRARPGLGTSAAAPPRERLRSQARSTGARTAPCRRAGVAAGRARAARGTGRGTPPCRRTRSLPGRSSRASSSSRSALPAKSPARRSPEPGVVR